MVQAIVIDGMTATKATVIANRSRSEQIGIIKSLMIDNLKIKLANGVAHFVFLKKDGTLREAWGTTQSNIVKAKTNGRGTNRETYYTTAYFDIEEGAWRSFRWETLVKVF